MIESQRLGNMGAYAAIRQASRGEAGVLGDKHDETDYEFLDYDFGYEESNEDEPADLSLGIYEV